MRLATKKFMNYTKAQKPRYNMSNLKIDLALTTGPKSLCKPTPQPV